jgi:hypothetical protein
MLTTVMPRRDWDAVNFWLQREAVNFHRHYGRAKRPDTPGRVPKDTHSAIGVVGRLPDRCTIVLDDIQVKWDSPALSRHDKWMGIIVGLCYKDRNLYCTKAAFAQGTVQIIHRI